MDDFLIIAFRFCFEKYFFRYSDIIYKQLDVIPMCINFAAAFAIILLIERNPKLIPYYKYIQFLGKYIDGCNGIWTGSDELFTKFHSTFNLSRIDSIDSKIGRIVK